MILNLSIEFRPTSIYYMGCRIHESMYIHDMMYMCECRGQYLIASDTATLKRRIERLKSE